MNNKWLSTLLLLVFSLTFPLMSQAYQWNSAEVTGEASSAYSNSINNKSKTSKKTRTIQPERFYLMVTDGEPDSVPVPLPNTKYTIRLNKNGQDTFLHEGITNSQGEIQEVTLHNIPLEGASLKIGYTLGNEQRGYIQNYNKRPYSFVFNLRMGRENTVHYSNHHVRFGTEKQEETFFYNFQAARINNYFDQAVQYQANAIKLTRQLFPNTARFTIKPINIYFEQGYYLDESNAFSRKGHDSSMISDIVIGDRSDKIFETKKLMHNIMHEWTHWNMYTAFEMPSGSYESHYSVNSDPKISYKEGWALFAGEMFADSDRLTETDTLVQEDNEQGVNRLLGQSTNMTVQQVIYDLLDVESVDEDFYISERHIDKELSKKEMKQLNFGIQYTLMMESEATTLQDFLTYIEDKYVMTASDKKKFDKVLKINGLAKDGNFQKKPIEK